MARLVRGCTQVSLAHYLLSLSLPLALNPSHLLRLHFYLPSSVMGQIFSSLSPDLGAPQTRISSRRRPFLGWGACLLRGRQLHSWHWRFMYAASCARRPSGDGWFRWFGSQNHRVWFESYNWGCVWCGRIAEMEGTWHRHEACAEVKQYHESGVSVRCFYRKMDHFVPAWACVS